MTNENPPPPPTAIIEPFLEPLDTSGNYILPTTQYIANAAILVVFAYLIPLIVMEVNYFRYAVWRSHGRLVRKKDVVATVDAAVKVEGDVEGGEGVKAGSAVAETKKEGSSSSGRSTRNDEENQRDIVMQNLTSSVSSDDISAVAEENKHDNDRKNGHQGGEELLVEKINSYYNTIIQEKKNNDDDNNDDDRKQSQTKNDNNNNNNNHLLQDTSRHSAVGHLMHDVRSISVRSTIVVPDVISRRDSRRLSNTSINKCTNKDKNNQTTTDQQHQQQQLLLHNAYKCIQSSSLISIILSLLIYTISATLIALYTRNMESKMVAVVTGSSKFVAAVIVFILSAKFPQWVSIILLFCCLFCCLFRLCFTLLLTNISCLLNPYFRLEYTIRVKFD